MVCSGSMTGSSQLKGLWPLPPLRGRRYTAHFLFSTGSGFGLGPYMGQGGLAWRLSGYRPTARRCCPGSLCEKLPPTVKDHACAEAETHRFLSDLAIHPQQAHVAQPAELFWKHVFWKSQAYFPHVLVGKQMFSETTDKSVKSVFAETWTFLPTIVFAITKKISFRFVCCADRLSPGNIWMLSTRQSGFNWFSGRYYVLAHFRHSRFLLQKNSRKCFQ